MRLIDLVLTRGFSCESILTSTLRQAGGFRFEDDEEVSPQKGTKSTRTIDVGAPNSRIILCFLCLFVAIFLWLMIQVVGHAGYDHAFLEKQRAFQQQ